MEDPVENVDDGKKYLQCSQGCGTVVERSSRHHGPATCFDCKMERMKKRAKLKPRLKKRRGRAF